MNDQDMLTEVVKRGVEGGYTSKKMCTEGEQSSNKYYIIKDTVYFEFREDSIPSSKPYSLPDLIANHAFMKMYGNEDICTTCNEPRDSILGQPCVVHQLLPAWRYHSIEAFKMIQDEEDAIKYLYDNLPSVK